MTVMRVERVVYGVSDLEECTRFFADFGLDRADADGDPVRFATRTGQIVELRAADDPGLPPAVEDGPTLREIVWGVDTAEALDGLAAALAAAGRETRLADGEVHTVDETGFGVGLAVSAPAAAPGEYPGVNRTGAVTRWNQPLQPPGRVRPLRLCHVAVNIRSAGRERAAAFYTDLLGFVPTDRVRDMGVFLRCPGDTDQHTLLLCHRPDRAGVNHTAYEVANVDEVIVGANDMIDRGRHEARRLGRRQLQPLLRDARQRPRRAARARVRRAPRRLVAAGPGAPRRLHGDHDGPARVRLLALGRRARRGRLSRGR